MTQAKTVYPENQSQRRTMLLAVDLKNSVLAEIDANNPNQIAYSPYGQQSSQREVMTRLGFNGEMREATPEWYLLGNGYRTYNPRLMRFHSPDSLSPFGEGGLNPYMYCGGEPVMNSDPTGHYFGWISTGAQKIFGGLHTLTTRTASIATTAASHTASAIGSGVSRVVHRARNTFDSMFSFDQEALKQTQSWFPKISKRTVVNFPHAKSGKKIPQHQGYANRTELPSREPVPQSHRFANRREITNLNQSEQNHGYSNRTEVRRHLSKSNTSTTIDRIRT
jgi:RHS repeat-associated protein